MKGIARIYDTNVEINDPQGLLSDLVNVDATPSISLKRSEQLLMSNSCLKVDAYKLSHQVLRILMLRAAMQDERTVSRVVIQISVVSGNKAVYGHLPKDWPERNRDILGSLVIEVFNPTAIEPSMASSLLSPTKKNCSIVNNASAQVGELSMWICHNIMSRHGGLVRFKEGQDSYSFVQLPLFKKDSQQQTMSVALSPSGGIGVSVDNDRRQGLRLTNTDVPITPDIESRLPTATSASSTFNLNFGFKTPSKSKQVAPDPAEREIRPLLTLPANPDAENGRLHSGTQVSTETLTVKVLIVDNSVLYRKLLRMSLEEKNLPCQCIVTEADEGSEVVHLFEQSATTAGVPFHCILIEKNLVRLNGIETTKILRSRFNYKGVIIGLTSNSIDVQDFSTSGVNNVFIKPFDVSLLFTELSKVGLI
jgi:CheY-like chemotaxis protein